MSAYWIDYGLSFVQSQAQFRVPLALQIVFALATILLIQFCPESPRWLLKHDREEDAKAVLAQLSVHDAVDLHERIEHEFATIKHALMEEEAATIKDKNGNPVSPVRACFTLGKERYFHRVMLGVGSQFFQQLCGINL
jgi:hypothetical protein